MCVYICIFIYIYFLVTQMVKNLPAMWETLIWYVYICKKNTINKKKKPKNNGKWALDMPLTCLAVLPHCNQGLTCHRALQGLPASLPQFSAPHTSVGLSSEPQKIFYTCLLHCSLLKTLKWPSICFSWSQKWQPTPVSLPGKFHGQRSLVGYRPWGCKKSDITEWLNTHIIRLLPVGLKTFSWAILLYVTLSFSPSCSFCGSQNHHHQVIFVIFFLSSSEQLLASVFWRKLCRLCPPDFSHSFHHSSDSLFQKTSATYWCFIITSFGFCWPDESQKLTGKSSRDPSNSNHVEMNKNWQRD